MAIGLPTNWGMQIIIVAWSTILILLFGVGAYLLIIQQRYNIYITLLKKAGDNIVEYKTKGGVFAKRKGYAKALHIRKFKLESQPPERKYYYINKKGKDCLTVYMPDEETAIPVKFDATQAKIQPINWIARKWSTMKHREARDKYSNDKFWDKYGQAIIIGGTMVFSIVIILLVLRYMTESAGAYKDAASAMSSAAKSLENAITAAKGTQIIQ